MIDLPPPPMMSEVGARSEPTPRRHGAPWPLVVLLAVAAVAAVVAATVVQGKRADLEGDASTRHAVTAVAGTLTETLFSFDYEDFDRQRDKVAVLATKGFVDQDFEGAFNDALRQQFVTAQATGEATVEEIFVGDITAEAATVVVQFDLSITSRFGERSSPDNFVVLSLVRTAEGWRVDGLSTTTPAITPDLGAAPTSTTSPKPDKR